MIGSALSITDRILQQELGEGRFIVESNLTVVNCFFRIFSDSAFSYSFCTVNLLVLNLCVTLKSSAWQVNRDSFGPWASASVACGKRAAIRRRT